MKSSGSNSSSNGNGGEGYSSKMERKTIEKQRRMQMKSLCFKLASLIPKQPPYLSISSKEGATQVDHLEEAASYIIKLRGRIEKLKERIGREQEMKRRMQGINNVMSSSDRDRDPQQQQLMVPVPVPVPIIEVRYQNSNLEVVIIINNSNIVFTSHDKSTFHKVIRIIEEEGADVVSASLSSLPHHLVYTLHSQIRDPRGGLDASRVSNRLREWI